MFVDVENLPEIVLKRNHFHKRQELWTYYHVSNTINKLTYLNNIARALVAHLQNNRRYEQYLAVVHCQLLIDFSRKEGRKERKLGGEKSEIEKFSEMTKVSRGVFSLFSKTFPTFSWVFF